MIEVEKKFILSDEDINRLIKSAEFLEEKVFTDIYYDTDDFSLTINDQWLRSRDGKFELKIPLRQGANGLFDQYDEIENEQKIKKILNLTSVDELAVALGKNGYIQFCNCKTTRRKYKTGLFIIDLDVVDFQDFIYNIGEIELMVKEKSEIEDAVNRITVFAKEQQLTIAPVRGKVIEYLKRARPDHYQSLIKSGVVKDF